MTYFLNDIRPPSPNDITPSFTLLTKELFDKLDGVRKESLGDFRTVTEKKAFIIKTFINTFRTHIGNDIYPSAKLIFPEKSGRIYFIKEVALARLLIKMYKIPKESEDYITLHDWNKLYQRSRRFSIDEKRYVICHCKHQGLFPKGGQLWINSRNILYRKLTLL